MSESEPMLRRILFLCTGNSCRSQMAEGWVRHLKGDQIEAYSAGIEAHGLNFTMLFESWQRRAWIFRASGQSELASFREPKLTTS